MFSIKRTIGGWRSSDGSGEKFNDAQAATILYQEAESFMSAVQKHLQLDKCYRCNTWGRLESDIHVLRPGDKPTCVKVDCLCNKFAGEDYRSDSIVTVAQLYRRGSIDKRTFEDVCHIEPLCGEVRTFLDKIEYPLRGFTGDRRVYLRFKSDFDQIDSLQTAEV